MSVCRFDPLVVVLFGLNHIKPEPLIELNGALIVHLNVKKDTVELPIIRLLDIIQHMFNHFRADPQSAIRRQTPQSHYIQSSAIFRGVDTTTDGADHYIVVIGFGETYQLSNRWKTSGQTQYIPSLANSPASNTSL